MLLHINDEGGTHVSGESFRKVDMSKKSFLDLNNNPFKVKTDLCVNP